MRLTSTISFSVIKALLAVFSRHGIPEVLRRDNGPQYASQEFAHFALSYGFRHKTSSPLFPRSNSKAERMVQTVKQMLRRSTDPHLALLSYRATPLVWCNLSPAELLMGRRIRTPVPQSDQQLIPKWSYLKNFRKQNELCKNRTSTDAIERVICH